VIFAFFVPPERVRKPLFRGEAPNPESRPIMIFDVSMIEKSFADFKGKLSTGEAISRLNEREAKS
jgi:hypothetical protein